MKIAALFSILTIMSAAASDPAGNPKGCSKADSCPKGEQFPCDLKKKSCGGSGNIKWHDDKFGFEPNRASASTELFCIGVTIRKKKYFYKLGANVNSCTVDGLKNLGSLKKVDVYLGPPR